MSRHLQHDLENIKERVLTMGGLVEEALRSAATAMIRRNAEYAEKTLAADNKIDRLQLELDDLCLKALALHQPVAGDLRFITATLKITNDLERIGDLAGNLSKRALLLQGVPVRDDPVDIERMVDGASDMLRDSLDALVRGDAQLARRVCEADDRIDDMHRENISILIERMKLSPEDVESAVALVSASRSIERIADLATNIAEDVVFLVEAVDIRHPHITKNRAAL